MHGKSRIFNMLSDIRNEGRTFLSFFVLGVRRAIHSDSPAIFIQWNMIDWTININILTKALTGNKNIKDTKVVKKASLPNARMKASHLTNGAIYSWVMTSVVQINFRNCNICRCNMHICSWNHMVKKYHGLIQEELMSPVHPTWDLLRICLIPVVSMFMWPKPCLGSQWSGIPIFFFFFRFSLFAELWTTISSKPTFCFSHIRKVLNLGGFCIPQSNMNPSDKWYRSPSYEH